MAARRSRRGEAADRRDRSAAVVEPDGRRESRTTAGPGRRRAGRRPPRPRRDARERPRESGPRRNTRPSGPAPTIRRRRSRGSARPWAAPRSRERRTPRDARAASMGSPLPAKRFRIEECVAQIDVRDGGADEDEHDQATVDERLLPIREPEGAGERPMVGERQVDDGRTLRQRLAADEANDAVLGVEPDRRTLTIAGARADDRDDPGADADGVRDVRTDAEPPPRREQLVGRPLE